jgi:hypothetical protein
VTEPAGTPADDLLALPASGEILADARGGGRWMRVTWHDEADTVVLSIWHETSCVSTFRLRRAEVPLLVQALVGGLAAPPR